jgi:basic amino acid/polyamine antiporter, APA family
MHCCGHFSYACGNGAFAGFAVLAADCLASGWRDDSPWRDVLLRASSAIPARAIAVQGAVAMILVALQTFQQIIAYFIFVAVVFLGLSVTGLFLLRRRSSAAPPFPTPGYPFTPIVFLVMVAVLLVLLVLLVLHSPRQVVLGCPVVLAGVPIHYVFKSRRKLASEAFES